MIKPKCLTQGDVVGVVAPSDAVERAGMEESMKIVEKWGLRVKMGKHVYSKVGDFYAGSPEERMEDLKFMIYEPEVKVIWAASGGYAATEVLPLFNREVMAHLRANPKWFIGYSDVCLLLNVLTSFKMVSVMGPTMWGLSEWDEESREAMRRILLGEQVLGIGSQYKWREGVRGIAAGQIVASNLETLIFSFGTRFDPLMYGSGPVILVIEELDIEKSALQRQIDVILAHKRANRISGVVVGRLVNIRELSYPEWGKEFTAHELILQRVKKWGKGDVPLAFCDDFGHAEWDYEDISEDEMLRANHKFLPVVSGISAKLTVAEEGCSLFYQESLC